ncbi:MAG: DsrE family protein [Pontixanthobacter sp.]
MTGSIRYFLATAISLAFASPLIAQTTPDFQLGPVFDDFGPHVEVPGMTVLPADAAFSHSFDVAEQAEGEERNRGIERAARFINMHVTVGVPRENIRIAVVLHGTAVLDLLTDERRKARDFGDTNPSGAMVRAMLADDVQFIICGQSLAGPGYSYDEMIPGVELALSAMTAHAQLQQDGYTVNPF